MVKKFLSLYFYDQESKCIYKKSQDLNSNHRKCLDKEQLIHMINKNHMKDHRKFEAIYDCLRKAIDIVSEPNEEHQEVQETNKGRQLENDHIVTETGDTYFTTETDDIANLEVTGGKSVMNNGLMDYFQKRQLEIYPLEMFSDNYQDIFTPTIGEYLQFKTNQL
ncbi:unnamed protein product [Mytilus coruscus]|uniref:Uncharacterized protein n=1 Tax=Mytilus coruscus TaxID=42192 RepID=A0A6J8BLB4_MYTCO|nr:unnamed protein product [Mytilus coruscus]